MPRLDVTAARNGSDIIGADQPGMAENRGSYRRGVAKGYALRNRNFPSAPNVQVLRQLEGKSPAALGTKKGRCIALQRPLSFVENGSDHSKFDQ